MPKPQSSAARCPCHGQAPLQAQDHHSEPPLLLAGNARWAQQQGGPLMATGPPARDKLQSLCCPRRDRARGHGDPSPDHPNDPHPPPPSASSGSRDPNAPQHGCAREPAPTRLPPRATTPSPVCVTHQPMAGDAGCEARHRHLPLQPPHHPAPLPVGSSAGAHWAPSSRRGPRGCSRAGGEEEGGHVLHPPTGL